MKTLLVSIAATIVLFPAAALAHTHLVRSSPAENAVLDKSPASATLVFAEAVTITAVNIQSAGGVKTRVQPLPANPIAEPSMPLPPLVPGHYTLSWRALSDDGHIMAGTIHFTVGGNVAH
jgi:copper transport protein